MNKENIKYLRKMRVTGIYLFIIGFFAGFLCGGFYQWLMVN